MEGLQTLFNVTRATRNKHQKIKFYNNRWIVKYLHGKIELKVTPKESKESVYVYPCSHCNFKIDGMANEIMLDGCKRFSVVLDDVISSIEVINSWNI